MMHDLNRACEIQLACAQMASLGSTAGPGGKVTEMPAHIAAHVREQLTRSNSERPLNWDAWLRQLDRANTSYKR